MCSHKLKALCHLWEGLVQQGKKLKFKGSLDFFGKLVLVMCDKNHKIQRRGR